LAITEHQAGTEQGFDGSDITFNYTMAGSGSDVLLVVTIAAEKAETITNVDWDNAGTPVALTQRANLEAEDKGVSIWTLANPFRDGSAREIRIRTASAKKLEVVVKTWAGVDSTDDTATDSGTDGTPDITIANTVTGSLCVDCLAAEASTEPTVDGGQTLIHSGGGGIDYGTSEEAAGASSTAMGWDMDSGKKFAYCGLELLAATTGAFEVTATQTLTHSSVNPVEKGLSRTATTVLVHSESNAKEKGLVRTAAQTLTHIDSVVPLTERFAIVAQNLTHSEAIVILREYMRAIAQSLTHSESIASLTERFVTAAQTLTHSEAIDSSGRTFSRTASQNLTHSESITSLTERFRTAAQNLLHSESISRNFGTAVTVAQSLTHIDTVTLVKGFLRTVTDTLIHSESIAKITEAMRAASQTLTHSEAIAKEKGVSVTASQNLTDDYSDSFRSHHSAPRIHENSRAKSYSFRINHKTN